MNKRWNVCLNPFSIFLYYCLLTWILFWSRFISKGLFRAGILQNSKWFLRSIDDSRVWNDFTKSFYDSFEFYMNQVVVYFFQYRMATFDSTFLYPWKKLTKITEIWPFHVSLQNLRQLMSRKIIVAARSCSRFFAKNFFQNRRKSQDVKNEALNIFQHFPQYFSSFYIG